MTDSHDRALGRLEGRLEGVEGLLRAVQTDVRDVKSDIRGLSRRTYLTAGGLGGAAVLISVALGVG